MKNANLIARLKRMERGLKLTSREDDLLNSKKNEVLALHSSAAEFDYFIERDLKASGSEAGAELVGSTFEADAAQRRQADLFEILGITVLDGFQGNLVIPKIDEFDTDFHEESAIYTAAAPETSNQTWTPHYVVSYAKISRRLMLQMDDKTEQLFLSELDANLKLKILEKIFHGTGSDGELTGLENAANISSIVGTDFSYLKALEMIEQSELYSLSGSAQNKFFLMHPTTKKTIGNRLRNDSGSLRIIENEKISNYSVIGSSLISENYIFFGDFSTILVSDFGSGLFFSFTEESKTGKFILTCWRYVDAKPRNVKQLIYSNNVT